MTKLIAIAPRDREEGNEIRPPNKCMCCGDSGIVRSSFLSEFVDGNNATKFICKRDCTPGGKYRNAYKLVDSEREAFAKKHGGDPIPARVYQAQFDYRLSAEICEQIHLWEQALWAKTISQKIANSEKLQKLLEAT
jgi:hypothetical protein